MENEILNYIKQAREHGLSEKEIKQNLLDVGWEPGKVEETFVFAKLPGQAAEPKPQELVQPAQVNQPAQVQATAGHPAMPTIAPRITTTPSAATSALAAQTATADSQFAVQPAKKSSAALVIGIILVILAGLGVGGYFAYGYYFPNPQRVWQKALLNTVNGGKIFTVDFDLSFTDPVNPPASQPNKGSLDFSGNMYVNASKADAIEFDNKLNFKLDAAGVSYNKSLESMLKNQTLYVDLSSISEIAIITGQPLHWIKIDYKGLQNYASSTSGFNMDKQKALQDKITADVKTQWQKEPFVTANKLLGSDTISGVATYHLQNQFDKNAFVDFTIALAGDIDKETGSSSPVSISDKDKQDFKDGLNKITFKTFETWVGKKDSQIYKISLDILAPSAVGNQPVLTTPNSNSPDQKKLLDVRLMSTALEMYFNDNNGYPAAQNGQPLGLAPKYIGALPIAPTPANGSCNDYYNTYWYTASGTPATQNGVTIYPSYELTFCFNGDTAIYKAGLAKLSPTGIQDSIPCTSAMGNCPVPQPLPITTTTAAAAAQSEFKLTLTYSDIGKIKDITPPTDALDIIKWIQDNMGKQFGSPPINSAPSSNLMGSAQTSNISDAQRLADVRYFASSLELYFNDYNKYPKSLSDLAPKYLAAISTAPEPPGGSCSEAQNAYTYAPNKDQSNYTLTFCFGGSSGTYAAGPHTLSNSGIK